MDVRLLGLFAFFLCVACGDKFNLETERGRKARIDEAKLHLTRGECSQARDAVAPLISDPDAAIEEEVLLIQASAFACDAGYSTLVLGANLATITNNYGALAKSVPNSNSEKIEALYRATDTLTQNGSKRLAANRSTNVNTLMAFIQLAVIGAILNSYGVPDTDGAQTYTLNYTGIATSGYLSHEAACALVAAHSMGIDSFDSSTLTTDSDIKDSIDTLNSSCASIPGISQCSDLNNDRSLCGSAGTQRTQAISMVANINSSW